MAGIYIHIPFCRSRCIYCDFFSTTLPPSWHQPYVEALERELDLRASELAALVTASAPAPLTLYLGGGTPSLLSPALLSRLLSAVCQYAASTSRTCRHLMPVSSPFSEITIEANPDDVTPEWVDALRSTPVNRISMGVQSLNDNILRTLRRRHTARQARHAVSLLRDAGYTNLSLDLIYGLPGQTLAMFEHDVQELLDLGIPHLSAYALQFEPGTPLTRLRDQGILREADEELSLACYQRLIDLTASAGLEHYEISNFARPGFRSRHNSSYWTESPYLGLGASAHSYSPSSCIRSFNCENIQEYIRVLNEGRLPSTTESLTPTDRYNERIMLRLRTCEGLSLTALARDFGEERLAYCRRMAAPHLRRGTLELVQTEMGETLRLTRQGLFVSDDILSDLMII
ncbi:MAG: radical SAM family heme chaperone HemW [Bacteroidaceae bacterium]|nr:radical SAM family heme chaperone HemW [Bacteroidaceae bacterium]